LPDAGAGVHEERRLADARGSGAEPSIPCPFVRKAIQVGFSLARPLTIIKS
jgi:hypothetical protein